MRLSTKGMCWNQEVGLSHVGHTAGIETVVKAFVRHHNKGKNKDFEEGFKDVFPNVY